MTNEQKQDFTRRITQANRSGLVVIKYEILFAYLDDASAAYKAGDNDGFKAAVRHADAVVKSFEETLDMKYEISGQLYALYDYHRRQFSKAMARHSIQELEESREMLKQLYDAFAEVSKIDTSEPLMHNTQQVYAGYTYGKNDLNENCSMETSRGFLA